MTTTTRRRPTRKEEMAARVLDRFGTTWASETGFTVRDAPSPLFRLLCLSMLLSARISNELAVRGARALTVAGWTTARKMVDSTWADRARTLNESGYARFDERTARMLEDSSRLLLDRWKGDLRKLREEAGREQPAERALLKEFKGIGDVGVDIFFREVQGVWGELSPFVDERARKAAQRLGLGSQPRAIASLVAAEDLPRFVAGLVRVDLEHAYDDVLESSS